MDRNWYHYGWSWYDDLSLSARRAWIEIGIGGAQQMAVYKVALRKESVDRNQKQVFAEIVGQGRSPQGERG